MIDMIDLLQKFKIVSFLFHIISDDVMEYDMIWFNMIIYDDSINKFKKFPYFVDGIHVNIILNQLYTKKILYLI